MPGAGTIDPRWISPKGSASIRPTEENRRPRMPDQQPERRLAAILAADVVGYSRLVRADEDGTLSRIKTLRSEVVDPTVAEHRGRIVKLMGDGILLEFASAVAAVRTAVDVQEAMAKRNRDLSAENRIEFRVGINLGDVVIDGEDIQGDGVNVAARLESLAEAGGICISETVHEQVRDRIGTAFTDMGPQQIKNIDRPVRAWSWRPSDVASVAPAPAERLELPDKPSIAVLAFDNMSGDPEQEFFADGIAEDIITALSRIEGFFVTARNSSFTYKGRAVDVQQVGRELGVRYVVEGSVRRAGDRVRITAQLIDATTGKHVWAEKYDRDLDDIFEVQDEITRNVVASTQIQIQLAEASFFEGIEEPSLPVWGLVCRAHTAILGMTPDSIAEAIRLCEQAIALDPDSGRAHQLLAFSLWHQAWMGFAEDERAVLDRTGQMAERAVRLNPRDESAHWVLAMSHLRDGAHDRAIAAMERSIEINPNYSRGYGSLATIQNFAGLPEQSIANNQIALRSNPLDPGNFYRHCGLAISYLLLDRLEEGFDWARKTVHEKPDWFIAHAVLIAYLVRLGRMDEARRAVADMAAHCPNATLADVEALPFRWPEDLEKIAGPVRQAMPGEL